MIDKIKSFLIGKLDADRNGKVNLDDARAKFGAALVNASLVAFGLGAVVGFVISKLIK